MRRNKGKASLITLLVMLNLPRSKGFEKVVTEQESTPLTPFALLVQIVTEPESLIRIFDGLNLSFEMARHWGRTGSALLRLPFNKDLLSPNYDYAGLEVWKRPHYARMPTVSSAEAPRYVRVSQRRRDDEILQLNPLWFQRKQDDRLVQSNPFWVQRNIVQ